MIENMTQWILRSMAENGAAMVFVGVIIESIIVPIPSPLIIMSAGALLISPGLSMAGALPPILLKIVGPGAVASTLGAYFAFAIAYWGGKPAIDRWGKYLAMTWEDLTRMEARMAGKVGLMIFCLRAVPIVPLSLVSAAAGILRLPLGPFTFWTFLGSIPRCLLLGYLGYMMRDSYEGLARKINSAESLVSAGIVAAVLGFILWLRGRWK